MREDHMSTYRTIIKAPVEKVWQALTDPVMVKRYFYGSELITDWKVGSQVLSRGNWEGKPYEDKGTVLSYEPGRALSFSYLSSWSGMPDKPENYLRVSYAVNAVEGGTELTIEQTNYDAERAAHTEGSWKSVIDGLKKLVED